MGPGGGAKGRALALPLRTWCVSDVGRCAGGAGTSRATGQSPHRTPPESGPGSPVGGAAWDGREAVPRVGKGAHVAVDRAGGPTI